MNLYSSKQRWKLLLLLLALLMVGGSLWYSNQIVNQIRTDERVRIRLWSDAVRSTVNQLYVTSKLFDRLREEERKKVKLWAKATQELGKDLPDYTFAIEVVQSNKTVPVILTDKNGKYSSSLNLDFDELSIRENLKFKNPDREPTWYIQQARQLFLDTIEMLKTVWEKDNPPIVINYKGKVMNTVFYRESKLVEELQAKKDSLSKSFRLELVKNQALVPVIFTDSSKSFVIESNFDSLELAAPGHLQVLIEEMSAQNEPIQVKLNETESGYIFYRDSDVLTQLRWFPVIQLILVTFFILVGYLIFSTFRRAEQNQVWAGMAKETAHQLGTPLSSLMAWIEILKSQGVDDATVKEMNKDILRLQMITDRFSKIGSEGKLENENVFNVIEKTIQYLSPRISSRVKINLIPQNQQLTAKLNAPLFEWVIENLIKNAVDAMEAEGEINILLLEKGKQIIIDINDTGKGIPGNKFKTIFEPGYSTKKRGWGLGLALAKRIVEYYHHGEIFVLDSEINKGSTFRIILKKE